jgi:L-aspartate oxidase
VPGLFAVGEVAATGVHGANRLASNGVTEGLVAGHRVAGALAKHLPESGPPVLGEAVLVVVDATARTDAARAMSRWVGPLRDGAGLREASAHLRAPGSSPALTSLADVEATNLLVVSELIVRAAQQREESRGSHRRLDFATPLEEWRRRIVQRWNGSATTTTYEPVESAQGGGGDL